MTRPINTQQAEKDYRETIAALTATYGPFRVPTELYFEASNRLRAVYVALKHDGILNTSLCSQYGLPVSLVNELGFDVSEPELKERRVDKYAKIVQHCKDHHREQVTVYDIAEIGEISYPTALKFVNDRPDLFYKLKKGLYEARDPEQIRLEEKETTK